MSGQEQGIYPTDRMWQENYYEVLKANLQLQKQKHQLLELCSMLVDGIDTHWKGAQRAFEIYDRVMKESNSIEGG